MRRLDGITNGMDVNLDKLWEMVSGEGQGGLIYCNPWGCKELDTTGQLNNNKLKRDTQSCRNIKLNIFLKILMYNF